MTENKDEMAEELEAQGLRHGQIHSQMDSHYHGHWQGHLEAHLGLNQPNGRHVQPDGLDECAAHHPANIRQILAIRPHSGIAGDMLLAGLAVLSLNLDGVNPTSREARQWLEELCAAILPHIPVTLSLRDHSVCGVRGWQLDVELPAAPEHRHLHDIVALIEKSALKREAREKAVACFHLLGRCEADAHGIPLEEVHFHEVGALDSILDICLCCELYSRLGSPAIYCGSLPIADGEVHCAHGVLPAPAPAVLRLLRGIPVHPFPGDARAGELLTPTGLALLRTFQAHFGRWPSLRIADTVTVYGQKVFADAPNGLLLALGAPIHSDTGA